MSVVIAAFNKGHAIGVKEACEKLAADNGWDPQQLYAEVTKKLAEDFPAKEEDDDDKDEDKEDKKEEKDDDKEDKPNGFQGGTTPEPPIG